MKFLSEFGACCGGGASTESTTTAGPSVVSRSIQGETSHAALPSGGALRKVKSANSSKQWKPSLRAISEDTTMVSAINESSSPVGGKVKAESKPKAKSTYYGEQYWKPSGFWNLPVFAPTLF